MSRIAKVAGVVLSTGAVVLGGAGLAMADAGAEAAAVGSPGVLSGNVIQAPIHVPVNLCGNTVNLVGLLNPAFGNACVNHSGHHKGDDKAGHHQGGDDKGGHHHGGDDKAGHGYGG